MLIGINTLGINRNDFGGGERQLWFLLRHLAKIDKKNEYFIFVNLQNRDRFTIEQKNFTSIICPVDGSRIGRIIYEHVFLPKLLKKHKVNILHSPNNVLPLRAPCKSALTIQYMYSFVEPRDYRPFYRRWYFNSLTKISARKADVVISVSHNNKQQIAHLLGVPETKIAVIYHGLDESFTQVADLNSIETSKAKYGIKGDYLLCVANNVLNKNLEGLIEAFTYLKQRYNVPHKLVIAGNTGFLKKRQMWLQKVKNKCPDLVHTGYIDHKELPCLYSGASVFVLPSYCESFGMPLLEAMACGVPIVTSSTFAMPEVTGDAALKVNPHDFREIGEGIHTLLKDNELTAKLVTRGFERAKLFTWEKTARETLKVLERVCNS